MRADMWPKAYQNLGYGPGKGHYHAPAGPGPTHQECTKQQDASRRFRMGWAYQALKNPLIKNLGPLLAQRKVANNLNRRSGHSCTMIWSAGKYGGRTIQLFAKHRTRQHMGPNHWAKRKRQVCLGPKRRIQTIRPPDGNGNTCGALIAVCPRSSIAHKIAFAGIDLRSSAACCVGLLRRRSSTSCTSPKVKPIDRPTRANRPR